MSLDASRLTDSIVANIEAIPDFPQAGQSPIIQDKRVIGAIAAAIIAEITGHADVVPAAHSGEELSAPAGQEVDVTTGPGAGSTGATTLDTPLTGKGSIV